MAGRSADRIHLDLNSPAFQGACFALELTELKQVVASLRRPSELDWGDLDRHTVFRWEAVGFITTPNGQRAYSLRLGQKARAIAYRDGGYLRLVSLHADHDSAYKR